MVGLWLAWLWNLNNSPWLRQIILSQQKNVKFVTKQSPSEVAVA